MVYVVFYRESTVFPNQMAWMDKLCGMYRVQPLPVDITGERGKYTHIRQVMEDYQDLPWVFMDHRGSTVLDEFFHPKDNVVYAVGSDVHGFQDVEKNGSLVRIEQPGEHYASLVLQMLLYDRDLFIRGRRK